MIKWEKIKKVKEMVSYQLDLKELTYLKMKFVS